METYFPFLKELRPDPLVDSEETRELLKRQKGMHVQSTPTIHIPGDYDIADGDWFPEDSFTVIDHG